jgi:aminoglycoside phosphotransferase (APT) family kinase protein
MPDAITAAATPGVPHGQDLVDFDRLTNWMDLQDLGEGPIEKVEPLTGGSQNVIIRFHRAGREFVLRRPPLHPTKNGSETMRREARVLGALAATNVPHARLVAACSDEDVLGAAFYLMEPVSGFNAALGLPPLHAGNADVRREMGWEIVDVLNHIGKVDFVSAGIADLGKIDGFLERQVPRWRKQLEGYSIHEGWAGPSSIPDLDHVSTWLEQNRPTSFTPGLMHGDYHFKNVMFSYDSPRIAAVVDWELSTIGDPLIDLGWLLATWRTPDEDASTTQIVIEPWDSFPTISEVIDRYALNTDRDMSAVSWYGVFACYKLGIILEGSYARAIAGKAPMATGERLHNSTLRLFARASRWISDGLS